MRGRVISFAIAWAVLLAAAPVAAVEPTTHECIVANSSGQDLRRAGKLHEARAHFAMCVASSCPGPVREDCAQRLDELDHAMPSIVFEVKDNAGADLTAVRVAIDGKQLAEQMGGTALAVDPGEHRFVFEAEGTPALERTVVVREGEKNRHEAVVLGVLPRAARAGKTSDAPAWGGQRTIGVVIGGAGVVGLVLGSVFAVVAKSTYGGAQGHGCPNACTNAGYSQGQSAYAEATAATVGLIAGGALLVGGAILYFTAPKGGRLSVGPAVSATGAGLRVAGSW